MRTQRGFSLLELIVVVIIISLLLVVAIDRLIGLQEKAERTAMENVIGTLKSAVGIKVAEHIVKQKVRRLYRLVGTNPMDQLAELPKNYLGVLDRPDANTLENGNWYFDASQGVLVYLVRHREHFQGGRDNPPRIRFQIRPVYADLNRDGRFDPRRDRIEGLRLAPVDSYRWKFK